MRISTRRWEIKRPLVHDDYASKHVLNPHATATRPDFLASLPPMTAATHKSKGRLPHVGVRCHKVTLHTASMQDVIAVAVCMGLAILFRKVTLQEQACKMLSGVNGC